MISLTIVRLVIDFKMDSQKGTFSLYSVSCINFEKEKENTLCIFSSKNYFLLNFTDEDIKSFLEISLVEEDERTFAKQVFVSHEKFAFRLHTHKKKRKRSYFLG